MSAHRAEFLRTLALVIACAPDDAQRELFAAFHTFGEQDRLEDGLTALLADIFEAIDEGLSLIALEQQEREWTL
jgi:hypothetical protein